jgi:hypothetical protein
VKGDARVRRFDMRRKLRWAVALVPLLGFSAATWWLAPSGVAGQQLACRLAAPPLQPAEPLEMNTVLQDGLFKTVVMEKEVFECTLDGQNFTQVRDVETFIEIVEQGGPKNVRVVEKRVEAATCIKDFAAGTVDCRARTIDLGTSVAPLADCRVAQEATPPRDPVEMNTVAPPNGAIKTIKVEKEILDCSTGTGPAIGDLYLFTEIIEARTETATGAPTLRPTRKRFEGILCFKSAERAALIQCVQFPA